MPARPVSIKVRALQWLAQREHSPQELRDKLLRLMAAKPPAGGAAPSDLGSLGCDAAGDPPASPAADPEAEVDTLLHWLTARGYLSSERFVESRVTARLARFGNLRIRQELQQHGLKLDDGNRQALQASEEERARLLWQRRYGQAASDAPARMRQLRFLAGRGFSMAVVRRVVLGAARSAGNADDTGDLDDMPP